MGDGCCAGECIDLRSMGLPGRAWSAIGTNIVNTKWGLGSTVRHAFCFLQRDASGRARMAATLCGSSTRPRREHAQNFGNRSYVKCRSLGFRVRDYLI
jgi:hypothetical protein